MNNYISPSSNPTTNKTELFTTKYAPQNSSQVIGQEKALRELKDYIVNYKKQKYKAALLHGPVGNGKTSAVFALAKELGYDLLEINSSDLRNEANLTSFLGAALGQQSLFFTPKLILIDEIDNISGVEDRGCIPALLKAMEKSSFPLIVTANDLYNPKIKSLKKECLSIEFLPLEHQIVVQTLRLICEKEHIEYEQKALSGLARQAEGDLRGALIDLQTCTLDKKLTFDDIGNLSDRKRTQTIINALHLIFKSSTAVNALPALEDVDLDYNEIFLWMDENLPKEYLNPKVLAKAYEHLARADVFQGRIRKRQHWRFLAYISELLTAGVSTAKESRNTEFVQYSPTMRILKIWQSNMKLAKKKEIAKKLAKAAHISEKVAFQQIPYLEKVLAQKEVR